MNAFVKKYMLILGFLAFSEVTVLGKVFIHSNQSQVAENALCSREITDIVAHAQKSSRIFPCACANS